MENKTGTNEQTTTCSGAENHRTIQQEIGLPSFGQIITQRHGSILHREQKSDNLDQLPHSVATDVLEIG